MKHLYTLLLSILALASTAQNWSTVDTIHHANFEPDTGWFSENYLSINIAIDSIADLGNATRLFNSPTVEHTYNLWHPISSFYIKDTTWLGPHCLQTTGGTEYYFNSNGDSIKIETLAAPNQPWRCYTFPNGDYIEASIDSVYSATFFSLTDSAKAISFTTFDSFGTPISHTVNSKTVALSKNYGWLKTLGFNNFPTDIHTFDLIGLSDLDVGDDDVTFVDVYDFQIGDEFHYEERRSGMTWGQHLVIYEILIVTGIQFSSNNDSVSVEYDREQYYFEIDFGSLDTIEFFLDDTYSENYHTPDYLSLLNHHPLEFSAGEDPTYYDKGYCWLDISPSAYNGRGIKKSYPFYIDDIWSSPITYSPYVGSGHTYYEHGDGIGLTHRYANGAMLDQNFRKLIYFNKNGEVWGDPINWSVVMNMEENDVLGRATLYPSATHDQITLLVPNLKGSAHCEIISMDGMKMKTFDLNQKMETIDVSQLSQGTYLIHVQQGSSKTVLRFVKV